MREGGPGGFGYLDKSWLLSRGIDGGGGFGIVIMFGAPSLLIIRFGILPDERGTLGGGGGFEGGFGNIVFFSLKLFRDQSDLYNEYQLRNCEIKNS